MGADRAALQSSFTRASSRALLGYRWCGSFGLVWSSACKAANPSVVMSLLHSNRCGGAATESREQQKQADVCCPARQLT